MGFLKAALRRPLRALLLSLTLPLLLSVPALAAGSPPPANPALITTRDRALLEQIEKLQKEYEGLNKRLEILEKATKNPPRSLIVSTYRLPDKVEFAGQPVPLDRWDVKERLEREFLLMVGDAPQVILWLKRSGRYFPMIEKKLKARHLPDDLKYVSLAESGLMSNAKSWAGAAGIWQFIPSTGRRYNIKSNRWKDERRNTKKSTDAALSYLSDLYDEFHDWPLALAAYNVGEAKVRKSMEEQHVSNYYQLALPEETERYVFRIIAAKLILSDPARYGYDIPPDELYHPLQFDTVTVKVRQRRVHLRVIAEAAGSYYREIRKLNPELKGDWLPRGTHKINIPKGSAAFFAENFKEWNTGKREVREQKIAANRTKHLYTVKKGDTLWDIASHFNVYVNSIRDWNALKKRAQIFPGQKLVIFTED